MSRRITCTLLLGMAACGFASCDATPQAASTNTMVQDAETRISLKKDRPLPGPCEIFNLNGTKYKGRFHCLVCEYGFDPVVMVFTQELKEGEDEILNGLVTRLDDSIVRNSKAHLRAFMVVLSPKFRSSATESWWARRISPREKLVDEGAPQERISRRHGETCGQNGEVGRHPRLHCPGRSQKLPPQSRAQVTVIFYKNLRLVRDPYVFEAGKMTQADVDGIITDVENELKKRPAPKK